MSALLNVLSGNVVGLVDVTAGTVWYSVIPGLPGQVTRLASVEIVNLGTNNGIYVMRPLAYGLVVTAATTATDDVILDRDPSPSGNTIASGDQVVISFADGTYRRCQVSSWDSATLTLTLTANLPANVSAGATLWNFGVFTDTEPMTSLPFPRIDTPVSATTLRQYEVGFAGWSVGQPLMLYCPNATNKTQLGYAEYIRTQS